MDLVHRSRGCGLVSRKGLHNLHWDLLSMAISPVEPILKAYDTYLPPLNSHRVQDAPLNNLDWVHNWLQLHRPAATDDRECRNLEFLCTLNTPSAERMRYLLDLCKDKKTAHLRRTLLETQDLLRIPLSFWKGASHQTDRGLVGASSPSLKNSPRSAASAKEFGQPTSWPRTDVPGARQAHVKGRPCPRRKRGPKPSSSRHWALRCGRPF